MVLNFSEAAESFATSVSTNTDNRVLIGKYIAMADYVNGDPSLPLYSRADGFQDSGDLSEDGKPATVCCVSGLGMGSARPT